MKLRFTIIMLAVLSAYALAQSKVQTIPPDCDHAFIEQKLDALQNKERGWTTPEVLGPLILGLGGWVLAVYTLASSRRGDQRKQHLDQLFGGLQWFHGGTQRRSVGIALIEGYRNTYWKDMGEIWVNVLVNQINHVLNRSASVHSAEEKANLERMVKLLTEAPLRQYLQNDNRDALRESFRSASVDPATARTRKGVLIDISYRDKCIQRFS